MNMFQKFFGREMISLSAKNTTQKSRTKLSVEPLEERQMLAITSLIGGAIDATVNQGQSTLLPLSIESESQSAVMLGIVVEATDESGNLDPGDIVVLDSEGNELDKSNYFYQLNGSDTSAIIVNLAQGDYQIRVQGDDNSHGSFQCDVFMPGVVDPEFDENVPGVGTGLVTQADALRALVAKDQDSGNYNSNTIQYYARQGEKIGLYKPYFDPAKSQYQSYFDLNSDNVISPQEAYLVQFNADAAAEFTVSLSATADVELQANVVNWLVSDATNKTKTAVLEIEGTTSSNVTKLEAVFVDATGASTTATDITSYLTSTSDGKAFTLDEEAILEIFGKTSGTLDYTDYKIKFTATTNDEKLAPKEFTLSFTYVEHSEPVAQSVAEKTLNAVSTDSSVEWNVVDLVEEPGTVFSYTVLSVVDEGGNTLTLTHGADPTAVKDASGTVVGYLSYTDGTVGADGKYYNGKLVYQPTADQVALSKGADDILVSLSFLVQDDSGATDNKTSDDETINVLIHPVNKTPVVDLGDSVTKTFNVGDAEFTYKLSGTASGTSAVIATDVNVSDKLSYNDSKMTVSVNGENITAQSDGNNRVWTTAQGTVITLVWDATTSSYTELKIQPVDAEEDEDIETEIIAVAFTVMDDAGVATAANGDQASETALQTLTITINGVDAAPVIRGSDLTIDLKTANDGYIETGWTATGKDITTYKIGTSDSNVVNIALGGMAEVAGLGSFRLNNDGSLTWINVDDAMKPTDTAVTSDFVFQAINAEGTGSKTFKITVTPTISYVFEDQNLYLSPDSQEVADGKVATGTVLLASGADKIEFTILSVKDSSGNSIDTSLFVIDNGKIVVEKDSLGAGNDLPFGDYTVEVEAVFNDDENNAVTANITLRIDEGTQAIAEEKTITIGEKATSAQEAVANVTGLDEGDSWTLVENSAAIDAEVQIGAHGSTTAYEYDLDSSELGKILSQVALTKDGNSIKCIFTPDTDYTEIFRFLSEEQTATLTLTYQMSEEYYGLVSTGTFTIVVIGANDTPIGKSPADKEPISVESTVGVEIAIAELLQGDFDEADTHFVVVPQNQIKNGTTDVSLRENGDTVILNSGATLTYVEDAVNGDYLRYLPNGASEESSFYNLQKGKTKVETITLYISDDSGAANAKSETASTVSVTLEGVNKPPYFNDENPIDRTITEKQSGTFTINIDDIASDPNTGGEYEDDITFGNFYEGDSTEALVPTGTADTELVYTLSEGSKIIISENGKILTFDPTERTTNLREYTDEDDDSLKGITWDLSTVHFTVMDDQDDAMSESEAKKTLNVTIEGVNDAPVAENITQNVDETDAVNAYYADGETDADISQWVKIDWQSDVYDPDIQETDMLEFTINGEALAVDSTLAFEDGIFALRMEEGELVLRFRPTENYIYLPLGESETLNYSLEVTDPKGETASSELTINIIGETSIPTVGPGVQTFYLATADTWESIKSVKYFTDRGDTNRPVIDPAGVTDGTFRGFSLVDGKIVIDNTDPALAADFEDVEEGGILIYRVPFTYNGEDAGYVNVSILKGEAPIEVDDTVYTLETSEKATTQVDRPYDPLFNENYTILGIDQPIVSIIVEHPDNTTSVVPGPDDLIEGTHYGINEEGRFWFRAVDPDDPEGGKFYFLREGQTATIVFNINIVNEYGKPIGGEAGKMTVIVYGVNDAPVVAVVPEFAAIYANNTEGIEIPVAGLFTDLDVDDAHTIIVAPECLLNEADPGTLKEDGDIIVLKSGATLQYIADEVNGDYLLYLPLGNTAASSFYSLKSGEIVQDVVIFKVSDDSETATAESDNGTLTFNVRGVNKTPVVNENVDQVVEAGDTDGITVTANELSTDANEGDDRIFVSITYTADPENPDVQETFNAPGSYPIKGTYQETADITLGTLTISADQSSFTFVPNVTLLTSDSNGLEPYDPTNPDNPLAKIVLNFSFIIRDSSRIAEGDPNEEPAQAASKDMKIEIRGTQGLKQKETDFTGSIHVDAVLNQTLDASGFFSGKNVTFTNVSGIPSDLSNTFLASENGIVFNQDTGQIELQYISAYDYKEGLNMSPIELEVTVQDEEGNELTETIRIHVKEKFTTKVYIIPSTTPRNETTDDYGYNEAYYKDQDFPVVLESYEFEVGQTYFLEVWVQDNLNELLGIPDSTRGIAGGQFSFISAGSEDEITKFERYRGVETSDDPDAAFIYFGGGEGQQDRGAISYDPVNHQTAINEMASTGPTEAVEGSDLGMPPKGWIMVRIQVQAVGDGTTGYQLVFETTPESDDLTKFTRYITDATGATKSGTAIHYSQIDMVVPTIVHVDPVSPLTGLDQVEKEVDGGIYMRTVTTPTQADDNGFVTELPSDADMLHEWQSHYVELWVKASEVDQYISAISDLNYNTDYFTAVDVERGSIFQYGRLPSINDSLGLVSGIGGSCRGAVSGDGYILLGRVRFESIGTDNVPWSEAATPHSLGLGLSNGVVQLRDGSVIREMGSGSKTELWANPYDSDDDGSISVLDFTAFACAFSARNDENSGYSNFNVTRTGEVNVIDFTNFSSNFGVDRKDVASGAKILYLPDSFTNRYMGATLKTDNTALVGTMLDVANQAWADALGLDKPIDVQLVVKDFGDSTTLAEAKLLEVDANGLPSKGIITLDDDATGLGWYSQIAEPVNASKYDLYTTLLHELGHLYGYNEAYLPFVQAKEEYEGQVDSNGHSLNVDDVMYEGLNTGERKQLSTLDVEIVKSAYALVVPGSNVLLSQTTTRLEALGAKIATNMESVEEIEINAEVVFVETEIAGVAVADETIIETVYNAGSAAVVATQFDSAIVSSTTVQLTVAVAQESALPQVVKSEENNRTLAELNTLGLDIAIPQVNPTYSIAANVDQVVGELFPTDEDDLFDDENGFAFNGDAQPELLDQLINDLY